MLGCLKDALFDLHEGVAWGLLSPAFEEQQRQVGGTGRCAVQHACLCPACPCWKVRFPAVRPQKAAGSLAGMPAWPVADGRLSAGSHDLAPKDPGTVLLGIQAFRVLNYSQGPVFEAADLHPLPDDQPPPLASCPFGSCW